MLLDLSLARTTLTRDLGDRRVPGGLREALQDPRTRVLDIVGDRAPMIAEGDANADAGADHERRWRLHYRDPRPDDAETNDGGNHQGENDDRVVVLLGRAPDGVRYLAQIRDESGAEGADQWGPGVCLQTLRDAGAGLGDTDTGVLTSAMALAHWHRRHPFCPRCGSRTEPIDAGWVRRCPRDASEHHPRTDAAVIVAVTDRADRILLARGVGWAQRRMSVLAGFVEAGETFEAAVVREVGEEVGVELGEVTYRGNQPWPFPASLMVGFTARARSTALTLQEEEIQDARWFSRDELLEAATSRAVVLPSRISIARSLIELWFGAPIDVPGSHRPEMTTARSDCGQVR